MNMVTYEKPRMTFVSLRNEEKVANTCWGFAGKDNRLFCNIEGEGYLSFQIAAGSCDLNVINVVYHYFDEENDNAELTATPTAAQLAELDTILRNSGGAAGNPYAGEGTTVVPDGPKPTWS